MNAPQYVDNCDDFRHDTKFAQTSSRFRSILVLNHGAEGLGSKVAARTTLLVERNERRPSVFVKSTFNAA